MVFIEIDGGGGKFFSKTWGVVGENTLFIAWRRISRLATVLLLYTFPIPLWNHSLPARLTQFLRLPS